MKQRRSPRFPFDSLVRVTAIHRVEKTRLWGRSTDLSPDGIGVTVGGELRPDDLVTLQIPLPANRFVTLRASVRYCNRGQCGFEFVGVHDQQQEAIQAACERLRNATQR